MTIENKIAAFEKFWKGEGPSLILMPARKMAPYNTENYPEMFGNPRLMWESEMRWAEEYIDWPTDGIPTVRPNLGVVFIPSMAGQEVQLPAGQMPWPGPHLDREALRRAEEVDITRSELMQKAAGFYDIHKRSGREDVHAYHPDTQGVFDISHILYGDDIFMKMNDDKDWIDELQQLSLSLYIRATQYIKELNRESPTSMIHGHSSPQGAYFPHAGTRMAEDTATLLSPGMIERFILPSIEKGSAPFGGAFIHFCGHHLPLFKALCAMDCVKAIDLGNPEMYATRELLKICAETDTVLYSRVAAEIGEDWRTYTLRISAMVRDTGARVILRPLAFGADRETCTEMRNLWHER
ncbi:MAG: hypothetical protein HQL31_11220, partial [Planctomycetes bacterium]|nr:hypothetical protein [Planctomycetota bacterium]